ncbi:sensor histidine kinase [Aureispira anguillae]|uniref:Histidine kinase n=1 Tax=Aureispira anguillae TaxID=2864201 RepID=A0A915YLJ5_9BACT|nr:histidine kinase [Aureispira anguillae]BDS15448.1 histidine kinase [Aureispira anguillae]
MKTKNVFLIHLILWLVFVLPISSASIFVFKVNPELIWSIYPAATWAYIVTDTIYNILSFGVSFYLFYFFVFKWLFLSPLTKINWLKSLGLFLGEYILELLIMEQVYPPDVAYPDIMVGIEVTMLIWLLFRLGLAIGARALIEYINERNQRKKLEQFNFQSELSLFRAQVNPHFLFNTLNNIDALIYTNPDQASATLIKLSKQMRYLLYDSNTEQIDLGSEIEFIQNYIDLERIRLKNKKFVLLKTSGNLEGIRVAPMLFIAFVENAFKHCKNREKDNGLQIELRVEEETLVFECENDYDEIVSNQNVKYSGVGLDLVKKRLDLIYGANYQLTINSADNRYKVQLTLPLSY